jgi:hypothetical protein
MIIKLQRVHYMPKVLEIGVLYVSEEFNAAAHLCPCGCGSKVRTPLGPTDWTFKEEENGPSLYPSIGNWQLPCKSHYLITNGRIIWCSKWTTDQIVSGRRAEAERARTYYKNLYSGRRNALQRLWNWLNGKLKSR